MNVQEPISSYNEAWNAHDVDAICAMHARLRGLRVDGADRRPEWDGVDVFPLRNGLILRKDVYSASHRPRALPD